jgi:hypothetical protein
MNNQLRHDPTKEVDWLSQGDVSIEVKPREKWQWRTKCVFPGCNQPSTLRVEAKIKGTNYHAAYGCCDKHIKYTEVVAKNQADEEVRFRRLLEPHHLQPSVLGKQS